MRDRRARNSSTMASTASCGPVKASTAAICEKADVHETELMIRRLKAGTSAGGTAAKPRRQPVMANVLLKPSRRIVRSAMPGNEAIEMCSPSYTMRP